MDERDEIRSKSRNLSEKKRRDQFNMLINELSTMVCPSSRKMDKSSVLRATIAFLKNHSELSVQSQSVEVQENWKPPFLSNEEFTHLMLEALDGFIIVFSCNGQILYSSESTASLLGYLPSRLYSSVFDIIHEMDKSSLYKLISNAPNSSNNSLSKDSYISLLLHMKRGPVHLQGCNSYELVNLIGTFYHWPANMEGSSPSNFDCDSNSCSSISSPLPSAGVEWRSCFIAVGRLQTPHLLRAVNLPDDTKNEFTSRHSLEWKFLFLDHRAPPIIGYLPFEVLGTSGYDYYHVDDLDNIAASHELLMQTGEGTSCFYRFLTKGQQWIWLQTRYYISYHQWNSKPEFIVCTHTVVSSEKVIKSIQDMPKRYNPNKCNSSQPQMSTPPSQSACISPSPSVSSLGSLSSEHSEQCSTKTGSSSVRVNTVLYSNHGNKEKIPSSPLTRATMPCGASVLQENFLEPHPNLTPLPVSQASDMNIISSTDHSGLSSTTRELQVYVSSSNVFSVTPTSPVIISTNVSGSQFQGERVQPTPEQIEYLNRRSAMLKRQIMLHQEELKRVEEQMQGFQYIRPVHLNTVEMPYQTSDISSVSNYVNTYSAPISSSTSSNHMLAPPIPISTENVIKSVDGYASSTQSYITSRSYQNLEVELCNVGTSENNLPFLSSEQSSNVIAQTYSMTHSMQPNS